MRRRPNAAAMAGRAGWSHATEVVAAACKPRRKGAGITRCHPIYQAKELILNASDLADNLGLMTKIDSQTSVAAPEPSMLGSGSDASLSDLSRLGGYQV